MENQSSKGKPGRRHGSKNRSYEECINDNMSRVNRNKAIIKEDLRKRFKGNQLIRQLKKNYREYVELSDELVLVKMRKSKLRVKKLTKRRLNEISILGIKLDCIKLQLEVIKAKVDLILRQLKFVLPELKGMELSDPEGKNPMSGFMNLLRESLEKDA